MLGRAAPANDSIQIADSRFAAVGDDYVAIQGSCALHNKVYRKHRPNQMKITQTWVAPHERSMSPHANTHPVKKSCVNEVHIDQGRSSANPFAVVSPKKHPRCVKVHCSGQY